MSTGTNRRRPVGRKAGAAAATPPPVSTPPVAPIRRRGTGPSWEERTTRQTYHLDNQLIAQLAEASTRTGISKSAIVTAALHQYLADLED